MISKLLTWLFRAAPVLDAVAMTAERRYMIVGDDARRGSE